MGAGDELRPCGNCGKPFRAPKRPGNKPGYCGDRCRKETKAKQDLRNKRKPRGRQCRWCGRDDSQTLFEKEDECMACADRAENTGRCQNCQGPLYARSKNRAPECPACDSQRAPRENEVVVWIHYAGLYRRVLRSKRGVCQIDGKQRQFLWIMKRTKQSEVRLSVSQNHFDMRKTSQPLLVKGLSPELQGLESVWPRSMAFESSHFMHFLIDLAHYLRLGEANPLTSDWYIGKFRSRVTREAGMRAWERLKRRLRDLGVPLESKILEDDAVSSVRVALVFKNKKQFVEDVEREMDLRESLRRKG